MKDGYAELTASACSSDYIRETFSLVMHRFTSTVSQRLGCLLLTTDLDLLAVRSRQLVSALIEVIVQRDFGSEPLNDLETVWIIGDKIQ
jgi:hypothetical protein